MDAHTFSIGLRSGEEAGVVMTLSSIPFSAIQSLVDFDLCLLSLSCYKQYPSGNLSSTNGMKFLSRISWYTTESITPINMQMLVLPRYEIPAKTCTLYACLGFGLRAQIFCTFDPGWWKNSRPEDDISTVLSSTKMMFLKSSLLLSASKHQLCLTWISNILAVNSFQIFGHV